MTDLLPDITGHSEGTLEKVRVALEKSGLRGSQQLDAITEMQNAGILFREQLPPDTGLGDISDGHHTFDELYEHRRALTSVLATIGAIQGDAWRSKQHHPDDSPMFDGSFIVGIELPDGPITYHYGLKYWDKFAAVPELEHARKWDGAGPPETIARLDDFAEVLRQAIADQQVADG